MQMTIPPHLVTTLLSAIGLTEAVRGGKKVKIVHDMEKDSKKKHNQYVEELERRNKLTCIEMDKLGHLELEVMDSITTDFSEFIKKFQCRPIFESMKLEGVSLPSLDEQQIKDISVCIKALIGALGGCALGTAGGIAASGAVGIITLTYGTASTGTVISSLSGAAATNAALAALGGGAISAGGGGMAAGATLLEASAWGVSLMIGGVIFDLFGSHQMKQAEKIQEEVIEEEKKVEKICFFLDKLKKYAIDYYATLNEVYSLYKSYLKELYKIKKSKWAFFTKKERTKVQNTVMLVGLLNQMCQTPLVLESKDKSEINKINEKGIAEATSSSLNILKKCRSDL